MRITTTESVIHAKQWKSFVLILLFFDREQVCNIKMSSSCRLNMKAVTDNPRSFGNLQFEVIDIDENAPHFQTDV